MFYVKKECINELDQVKDFNTFLIKIKNLLEEDKAFSAPLTHIGRKPMPYFEQANAKALEEGYEPLFFNTEH
jgi:hypothetical protein